MSKSTQISTQCTRRKDCQEMRVFAARGEGFPENLDCNLYYYSLASEKFVSRVCLGVNQHGMPRVIKMHWVKSTNRCKLYLCILTFIAYPFKYVESFGVCTFNIRMHYIIKKIIKLIKLFLAHI